MDSNFIKFLKTLNKPAEFSYREILQKMQSLLNGRIDIRNINSAGNSKSFYQWSGYINKIVDSANNLFISWRVSAHLPTLENIINMNKAIPADKEFGHLCLLMMGSDERNHITPPSEKGNHKMTDKRTIVKVKTDSDVFAYYGRSLKIPYHIYHFVTDLLTESDLKEICLSTEGWLTNDGDMEFVVPEELTENAYYRKYKKSGISSIDCEMNIQVVDESSINEVRAYSGNNSLMIIDMGYVTIISPDGEEKTLHGTLEVNSCNDRDVDVLNLFRNYDSSSSKKRYENKETKDKMNRLYENIMKDIANVLEKHFSKLY